MPKEKSQKTPTFDELVEGSPVYDPITQLRHTLPPRYIDLSRNLALKKGRVVALPMKYRWRGMVWFFFMAVGLALAGKVFMDAVMQGTLTLRGIYGGVFAFLGYTILMKLAIKKHKPCISGISQSDETVRSLYGDTEGSAGIRDICELSIKTLTTYRQLDRQALRKSSDDVVAVHQAQLREQYEDYIKTSTEDPQQIRKLIQSDTACLPDRKVHYLQAKTYQGDILWVGKSEELGELLSLAAYLRDRSALDDEIQHDTFYDARGSDTSPSEWRYQRDHDAFSLVFFLTSVFVAGGWLARHPESWAWLYIPNVDPRLSLIIHIILLVPLGITLIAHCIQPRYWQLIMPNSRPQPTTTMSKIGPWLIEKLQLMCLTAAVGICVAVYVGLRFVTIPDFAWGIKLALMVVGGGLLMFIPGIFRAVTRVIERYSTVMASLLEKKSNPFLAKLHQQGAIPVTLFTIALILAGTVLTLGFISMISWLSFFLMNAPVTGGGGKSSIPIYFDLFLLYLLLRLFYEFMKQLLGPWLALLTSAVVNIPVLYVAIVLTALPALSSLPIFAVIFWLSVNVLAVARS